MDSINHFTALPPPATGEYLSWFFPLWVLINVCRCGFIQVAKKQQKQ
ncbi:hypothetical protein IE986_18375 [Klebsiella pneumoniae]|uniref:Uncharacterized protein n=1 Tax=Klebsiella pneumoniae TaxID=573 RepID=A0A927HJ15_KLEPN|nr:hypothetical protein [Klebsiella pneumoniae]